MNTEKEEVIKGVTQEIWERQKNISWGEAKHQAEHQLRYWNEEEAQ